MKSVILLLHHLGILCGARAYRYRDISNICMHAAVNSVKYYHNSLLVIYNDIIWIRINENDISAYNMARTEADKVNSMLYIKQWVLVYSCTTSTSTWPCSWHAHAEIRFKLATSFLITRFGEISPVHQQNCNRRLMSIIQMENMVLIKFPRKSQQIRVIISTSNFLVSIATTTSIDSWSSLSDCDELE